VFPQDLLLLAPTERVRFYQRSGLGQLGGSRARTPLAFVDSGTLELFQQAEPEVVRRAGGSDFRSIRPTACLVFSEIRSLQGSAARDTGIQLAAENSGDSYGSLFDSGSSGRDFCRSDIYTAGVKQNDEALLSAKIDMCFSRWYPR